MRLSKTFFVIIAIITFSVISFLSGIQFQKSANKTNTSQTETTQTPQSPQFPQQATVSRVIDGDTVELSTDQTVRYTGIAAPEKGEPYYLEAADLNQKLTLGKQVRLEYEKGYEQDKFGRLLAYAFVVNSPKDPNLPNTPNSPHETFVNLELVKAGLAKVSIYEKRRPLVYQKQLSQAQTYAQKLKLYLWSGLDK